MGAHNDTANDYQLFNTGGQTIADPGSGGTFNLRGIDRGIASIASGTRKLPNNTPLGVSLMVYATGSVTITNASGTTIGTLSSGHLGVFIARTSTSWNGTVLEVGAGSNSTMFAATVADIAAAELTSLTSQVTFGTLLTELYSRASLPNAQFTTSATTTSITPAAGALSGARHVIWQNTADGTLALTPRTASQLYGDLGNNAYVGMSYLLTITNRGDNTITLQSATGITYTGEQTIATLVTRTYVVTFTSASAATVVAATKGTIET